MNTSWSIVNLILVIFLLWEYLWVRSAFISTAMNWKIFSCLWIRFTHSLLVIITQFTIRLRSFIWNSDARENLMQFYEDLTEIMTLTSISSSMSVLKKVCLMIITMFSIIIVSISLLKWRLLCVFLTAFVLKKVYLILIANLFYLLFLMSVFLIFCHCFHTNHKTWRVLLKSSNVIFLKRLCLLNTLKSRRILSFFFSRQHATHIIMT